MVFTFHLVKIIQKKFAQNYFFTTFAIPSETEEQTTVRKS